MKEWVRDLLTIMGFGWLLQAILFVIGVDPWATLTVTLTGIITFTFALWMGMFD